jgi:hypothetical protein
MAAPPESADPLEQFDPLDQMEQLVESSLRLIFSTYDEALRERVRQPVVLLLDCEDVLGREIAEAWLGSEAVQDAVAAVHAERVGGEVEGEPSTTVFARPMPLAACRQEIPPVFPYLRESFEQPPREGIFVMAVTAGGAATFTVPYSSRPEAG